MRKNEIKVGKTYAGKSGHHRTVTAITKPAGAYAYGLDVKYTTSTGAGECFLPTFASWAKMEAEAMETSVTWQDFDVVFIRQAIATLTDVLSRMRGEGVGMATMTTVSCDICKSVITDPQKKRIVPVVFLTEQTEGRRTEPYISIESIDICQPCHRILIERTPLTAEGAQGYNSYSWRTVGRE